LNIYRGKQVCLRPFEWEDAEKYRHWVNDPEILSLVDRVLPVTAAEHRPWYEAIVSDPRTAIFSVDLLAEELFVGCVWLSEIDYRHRHAELRILIGDKRYWGKGIGEETISVLVRFAFEHLNLHKVYAYVLSSNRRAVKAFDKAGFAEEGLFKEDRYINGQYTDVVRLGIVRKGQDRSSHERE